MNDFLQKLIHKIAPCGHDAEIARLNAALADAEKLADSLSSLNAFLKARHADLQARFDSLLAESAALTNVIVATHPEGVAYIGPVESLIAQRERDDRQKNELVASIGESSERVRELLEAAEESTGRIVELEQQLAEAKTKGPRAQQTTFLAEPGGEMPIPEDKIVLDRVVEIPLAVVGIFFDHGSAGRRHNWVFRYGKERPVMPIIDKAFRQKVDDGKEVFRAGDVVLAEVHVRTRQTADGHLYPDFVAVEKVKKLSHGPQARALFDAEPIDLALCGASTTLFGGKTCELAAGHGVPGEKRTEHRCGAIRWFEVGDEAEVAPATCACGTALETAIEREFNSCERCLVQAANERRVENGTLITREEAAGVTES